MPEFGVIKKVNPREVWPGEAADFTPWLAENLSELGAVLGMELELEQREAPVGGFSADILARDVSRNRMVVIENQFGVTNHDHLGKLLTYAAGYDAATVIWIAEEIREEHRQALDWLNQRTDENVEFFGVIVEVLRIDDSRPAPQFRPVAFPNEWQKATRSARPAPTERGARYQRFFQAVIDDLRRRHGFTGIRTALPQSWVAFSSGVAGVSYGLSFAWGDRVRADVYIDRGDAEWNTRVFEALRARRDEVERQLGRPLEWEPLEGRRACRIAAYRAGSIDADEATLAGIREWAVATLADLKRVFGPLLKDIAG
ncbi:DUF4268 domain-containing protein [Caldinitratiruptor microaerophilus]|uniref:DUF4268 domain-containing protein n=1 Tax=Caldinitratiruptor microaerophilus TaxID=671077 RepID=A0AA35CPM0_9FIRM|nr:DUF4268 domain-containing protein [Caldinitratiruptor microaerophilus]BDG61722.1 hypothetical protein caldi_28120 [Caldinitratiruptor microaerophilus]